MTIGSRINREFERDHYKRLARLFDLYADDGDKAKFRMRLGGIETALKHDQDLLENRQFKKESFRIELLKRRFF